MTWDEIQLKWAAMARRVRSDLPIDGDSEVMPRKFASPLQPQPAGIHTPMQPDRTDA